MNGVLVLVLGVALSFGVFSLLFIKDTIPGAVRSVLMPLVIASASSTAPGDSSISDGILSGAFLVLVAAQALNTPNEEGEKYGSGWSRGASSFSRFGSRGASSILGSSNTRQGVNKVPEAAVIFVTLMFILGTLGESAMVAQLCAFFVLAGYLFGPSSFQGTLYDVLSDYEKFDNHRLKFWGKT